MLRTRGEIVHVPGSLWKRRGVALFGDGTLQDLVHEIHIREPGIAVLARQLDLTQVGPVREQHVVEQVHTVAAFSYLLEQIKVVGRQAEDALAVFDRACAFRTEERFQVCGRVGRVGGD